MDPSDNLISFKVQFLKSEVISISIRFIMKEFAVFWSIEYVREDGWMDDEIDR